MKKKKLTLSPNLNHSPIEPLYNPFPRYFLPILFLSNFPQIFVNGRNPFPLRFHALPFPFNNGERSSSFPFPFRFLHARLALSLPRPRPLIHPNPNPNFQQFSSFFHKNSIFFTQFIIPLPQLRF